MAGDDLQAFAVRIRQRGEKIKKNADILKRATALAAHSAVVRATPVDTGRARSNWIASTGVPIDLRVDPLVPGTQGSTGSANSNAAIAEAQRVLSVPTRPGDAVYLQNNLPYIGKLNEGSSRQAPPRFVEQAVEVAISFIRGARLLK